MITITEQAKNHFKKLLTTTPDAVGIEVSIRKFGCSGFKYEIKLIDELHSVGVHRFDFGGLYVFIRETDLQYLSDVVIDMTPDKLNKKIVINNQLETGRCGCGESFSLS